MAAEKMWLEILKPVALLLCLLSLYAVFHAAFLVPSVDLEQRILHVVELLALSAAISIAGGILFAHPVSPVGEHLRLRTTLPVQVFCWAVAVMFVLFALTWYLENYGVFYKDWHRWS